jgi:hypothetical protein
MKLEHLHLIRGETLLGKLSIYEFDMPWVRAKFEPTPAFADAKPIFDREVALLDTGDEDGWQEWELAQDEIEKMGLHLVETSNGTIITQFLLHIENNEAWFRYILEQEELYD